MPSGCCLGERVVPRARTGYSPADHLSRRSVRFPSAVLSDMPQHTFTPQLHGLGLRPSGLTLGQWAAQGAVPCDRRPINRAPNKPGFSPKESFERGRFKWARGTTRRGK
jgi:hypothetical protein